MCYRDAIRVLYFNHHNIKKALFQKLESCVSNIASHDGTERFHAPHKWSSAHET